MLIPSEDIDQTRMAIDDRTRWNQRYRSGDAPRGDRPNRWFAAQHAALDRVAATLAGQHRAPVALDVACGAGGTVLWLAQRGWHATGVDVSDAALALASQAATRAELTDCTHFLHADLDAWRPAPDSFDCITCFFFLERRLWPALREAVRPGGLLAMQTYTTRWLTTRPESNPAFLLAPGELATLVAGWGWTLLTTGDPDHPIEAVLAQRPAD